MDINESEIIVRPRASALSQSLRDIGYSLESSIADLIDNCITARAKNIWIDFTLFGDSPKLVITDDGVGMDRYELIEAMRPGSSDPRESRNEGDLGRFGLGLKTASFSQCTVLTVLSKKNNVCFAATWDLDVVAKRNEWVVKIPSDIEIEELNIRERLISDGTVVLWQNLDRLIEEKTPNFSHKNIYEKFDTVDKHLSIVFHRYLSGEFKGKKLAIHINGNPVKAFDPFCINNKATQILREEIVRVEGHEIKIQPYILPHHSKLSNTEQDFYKSRNDFLNNQGAYIYRNGRLMAWGDWFRLIPRGEATKLARVKIDFPNALDDLWTIDIKKSRAHPPLQVKDKLKHIIDRIAEQSKRVHAQRGSKLFNSEQFPVWERVQRNEKITYKLNRENPLLLSIMERFNDDETSGILKIIEMAEATIPIEAIYSDYSVQPRMLEFGEINTDEEIKSKLQEYWQALSTTGDWTREEVFEMVVNLKPFKENLGQTKKIIKEILNND
jgi:hypothetical protein